MNATLKARPNNIKKLPKTTFCCRLSLKENLVDFFPVFVLVLVFFLAIDDLKDFEQKYKLAPSKIKKIDFSLEEVIL
jgi:hypothetical protein